MSHNAVKVLIIEDDPDVVEAMRIMLEAKGYEVSAAFEYEEGLKKTKDLLPNIILLDATLMLNDRSGLELPAAIRKDIATSHIPILMITAINEDSPGFEFSPGDRDERLPIDDFMNKPAQPAELYRKIENLLKMKVSKWAQSPGKQPS
ncbi:MAG: response regulator [Elusimicrobia bacterium]|nr:response regulator [Elusimicrobiota bacterium]